MKKKFVIHGILASSLLFAVYFAILSVSNSFSHAISQFLSLWYFIIIIVVGFGVQIALYSYVHNSMKSNKAAKAEIVASSGISTSSMIACCAHHLTDVLPVMGLSALSLLLVKYQLFLIVLGIASNSTGITMMLGIIQNNNLYDEKNPLFKINMKDLMNIVILISLIALVLVFFQSV